MKRRLFPLLIIIAMFVFPYVFLNNSEDLSLTMFWIISAIMVVVLSIGELKT